MNSNKPAPEIVPWEVNPLVSGYHWPVVPTPRATLLLQHGYGEHANRFVTRYSEFIPHLLAKGIEVYAIDLPGHGSSQGRRGSIDVHEAVQHHMAAKRSLQDKGPLLLFGHSLGALVTASTVAQDSTGISGVILTSAALHDGPDLIPRAVTSVLSRLAPHAPVPGKPAPTTTLSRLPENEELLRQDPLMYTGQVTNLVAASALRQNKNLWRLASQWTVPTLIMHGDNDQSTNPSGSRRLYHSIKSSDKSLHIIEGGHHELLNDIDSESTLAIIDGWIENHLG